MGILWERSSEMPHFGARLAMLLRQHLRHICGAGQSTAYRWLLHSPQNITHDIQAHLCPILFLLTDELFNDDILGVGIMSCRRVTFLLY